MTGFSDRLYPAHPFLLDDSLGFQLVQAASPVGNAATGLATDTAEPVSALAVHRLEVLRGDGRGGGALMEGASADVYRVRLYTLVPQC